MTKYIITPGEKYGMLTIIGEALKSKRRETRVICLCDCGTKTDKQFNLLRMGVTKSCGCLWIANVKKSNTKHGLRKTPHYGAWNAIKNRCYNKNVSSYYRYGGRGITMCPQWCESFEQFYKDMGPRPSSKHSVDRINNDGDYEPSNCKWSTREEQDNNKSSNIHIYYDGKNLTVSQWSKETGIPEGTLRSRIERGGTPERILHKGYLY